MADQKDTDLDKEIEGADFTPEKEAEKAEDKATEPVIEEEDVELKEDEIPIRNNAAQIIARKNRQLEKLRAKQKIEEEKDDETDEEDTVKTGKDPRVDIIMDALASKEDEASLKDLISEEPDAKKYENKIKSYMKHPSYKDVPVAMIYAYLSSAAKKSVIAKKKQVADKEADMTKGGGKSLGLKEGRAGNMPTVEELNDMSEEEFSAFQLKVQAGKFS